VTLHGVGRAIAQAVSCRLPKASAHVRSQVRLYEICGGQNGALAGFLLVLQFPMPILIPPIASYSLISLSSRLQSLHILGTDSVVK
jgi:hypothetical protein